MCTIQLDIYLYILQNISIQIGQTYNGLKLSHEELTSSYAIGTVLNNMWEDCSVALNNKLLYKKYAIVFDGLKLKSMHMGSIINPNIAYSHGFEICTGS